MLSVSIFGYSGDFFALIEQIPIDVSFSRNNYKHFFYKKLIIKSACKQEN
jgi:hypothetical protein